MSSECSRCQTPGPWARCLKELVKLGLPCALVASLWLAAIVLTSDDVRATTIHDLAIRGDKAGVERELARHGVDVNAGEFGSGRTPLMAAARHGHVDTAKLLLSRGADVRACAGEYGTALTCAASDGNPHMVRLLLHHRSDPNALTPQAKESPLMLAADYGHGDAAGLLIAAGADVNAQSRFGRSPLMCAASGGHDSIVRQLLAAGGDRAARDRNGETAVAYAASGGHHGTGRLIERHSP